MFINHIKYVDKDIDWVYNKDILNNRKRRIDYELRINNAGTYKSN